MRSDIRLLEDTLALPTDPTRVGVGQFRTAIDGMATDIIIRRKVGSTTTRTASALGLTVEAPTGANLAAVALGTCLKKDAAGMFVVASANFADVYFLQRIFNRGATQWARAVRGDKAATGVGRTGAAINAVNVALEVDANGLLIPSPGGGGRNIVAVSESTQTAPNADVIITPQTYVL